MTPEGYESNRDFERRLRAALKGPIEQVINEVAQTHAGCSEDAVRAALVDAAEKIGVSYQPSDDIVSAIAEGRRKAPRRL
jgi:geranylgeranyl pyrophosphate synthase